MEIDITEPRHLRNFLDQDWKYWIAEYPEFATIASYPGRNDRWTDFSPSAIERRNQHLEVSLKALQSIPRGDLSTRELLNYQLYEKPIETAIAGQVGSARRGWLNGGR